jgi:hypothetical protein
MQSGRKKTSTKVKDPMAARTELSQPSFSNRVLDLLSRVEHRVAKSSVEREAVYRLRYDAYRRRGLLTSRTDERLYDEAYDEGPNAWITSTFIEGELAGTLRVNVSAANDAALPCYRVFSDIVGPLARAGNLLVEFTRFAAKLELARIYSDLAYAVVRPGYMALAHFRADFGVTCPRDEFAGFHRRVFRFEPWSEPRTYPGVTVQCPVMGMEFGAVSSLIEERYPFLKSTERERTRLFGPSSFGRPSMVNLTANRRLNERTGAELES